MRRWSSPALVVVMWFGTATAQERPDGESGGAADRPSEQGIRLTPGMARSLGRLLAEEELVKKFGLDSAKSDQAAELLARRIMQVAHEHEEKGQEAIEALLAQALEMQVTTRHQGYQGLSRDLTRELARQLPPLMPAIRNLINGAARDVRPMLPLKGQLKLTGELTMVNLAADAFEQNLEKWGRDEFDPFADPFRPKTPTTRSSEDGQSQLLRNARRAAESSNALTDAGMRSYLEDAEKYYQLDVSQAAAADSLLREYQERARIAVGGDERWRAHCYRYRLWMYLSNELPGRWYSPVSTMLWEHFWESLAPVRSLKEDFVEKIEAIPTQAQRQAAEARLLAALEEKGYGSKEPPPGLAGDAPAEVARQEDGADEH